MNDMLISMGIALVLEFLKSTVKNPTSKRKWKNAMLKVANAIFAAYGNEPEFQEAAKQ
jgi:hypothetical protein